MSMLACPFVSFPIHVTSMNVLDYIFFPVLAILALCADAVCLLLKCICCPRQVAMTVAVVITGCGAIVLACFGLASTYRWVTHLTAVYTAEVLPPTLITVSPLELHLTVEFNLCSIAFSTAQCMLMVCLLCLMFCLRTIVELSARPFFLGVSLSVAGFCFWFKRFVGA
ncbi:unnamed protein product [Prorocentrum cordatum]|uniref:Dolichyl-diphosphooligosaccharide--protein glycosyltransferase subunit KCP2 n=1 Tax=Prorocentrum cordatum TaxID=2364126 RepID=A0ABN9SHB0_9DINO|nr:unnamed protein product [Polarella glacialis]